jgi:GT2 family glycosyltransferase
MPEDPKVSIIIVVYNGLDCIGRCIESVLETQYNHFEIIAVDNASTDGSAEYIRRTFPSVIVVEIRENLGYAGGINAGLSYATGEYVAPLNMDIEVESNWLKPMVDFVQCNPSAGAVTPKILLDRDRARVNTMGGNIHVTGLSFCRDHDKLSNEVPDSPETVPGISGASYVISRNVLERAGGAPAQCFMGNDDVVLSWTLHLMGYDLYCIPQSVVYHDYQLVLDPDKYLILERNRLAMVLSCLRVSTLLLCLPLWALAEAAIFGYSLLKGTAFLRAKAKAYMALWQDRGGIRERRMQIQKIRRISDWELFRRLGKNLDWGQLLGLLDRHSRVPQKGC